MSKLRSMTGYGTAHADWQDGRISITLRTVNHRFLDIVTKLPADHRHLEQPTKTAIKNSLARGRVEVALDVPGESELLGSRLNLAAANKLKSLTQELETAGLIENGLRAIDYLRFPEVIDNASTGLDSAAMSAAAERARAVLACLEAALKNLVVAREVEGEGIAADLGRIVDELAECLKSIVGEAMTYRETLVDRYAERISAVLGPALEAEGLGGVSILDQQRLLQEAGVLAERVDVAEELERLEVHLSTIGEVLRKGGPCGKRLDFLAQELLREFNTIASKCRDASLATLVVDAKVLCERFREQIQNVE